MEVLSDRQTGDTFQDADSILCEMAECRRELARIKSETARSIRILREWCGTEQMILSGRLEVLKKMLLQFVEANRDKLYTGTAGIKYVNLPNGAIGFKRKVSFKTSDGCTLGRNAGFFIRNKPGKNPGMSGVKLNRLDEESLKKIGISRIESEEFYCVLNGKRV